MAITDKQMDDMVRELQKIEMERKLQSDIPPADREELRRYYKLTTRLQEELALYEDFHLWLKFSHPDIVNEYKAVQDIKEKANEPR
jgi:hypothetical protein